MLQIKNTKEYLDELQKVLSEANHEEIDKIIDVIMRAYKANKQVFILGNGGSASTASHFATDLSKGTLSRHYDMNEKRFRVYSLSDNTALITAIANDLGFEDVFSQQLKNLIQDGDVLIAITASGNSPNVLKAIKLANESKAVTIGLLGFTGGKAAELVDHKIIAKREHYGLVEDYQMILGHLITNCIKERLQEANL